MKIPITTQRFRAASRDAKSLPSSSTGEETRISLRAKEYANVGKLAEEFGGGGHWKASGCTIHETFADAEPVFVKAAEKYL